MRKSLHEDLEGETYAGFALVADIEFDCQLRTQCAPLITSPDGYVLLVPLPEGRWTAFVQLDEREGERLSVRLVEADLGHLIEPWLGGEAALRGVGWAAVSGCTETEARCRRPAGPRRVRPFAFLDHGRRRRRPGGSRDRGLSGGSGSDRDDPRRALDDRRHVPGQPAVLVRPGGYIGFRSISAHDEGLGAIDAHLESYLVSSR
jgi:hypothetical protein